MKYSAFLYIGFIVLLVLLLEASAATEEALEPKDDDQKRDPLTDEHVRVRRGDDDDDDDHPTHPFDPFHLFRAIFKPRPPPDHSAEETDDHDTVTKLDTYDTHRSEIEMNPYFRIINTFDRDFCAIRMICEVGRPKKRKNGIFNNILNTVLYGDHDRRKRDLKRPKRFFLHKLFQAKEAPDSIEEHSPGFRRYKIGSHGSMETSFEFDFHEPNERPGYPYEYYVRGTHGEYTPYSRGSRRGGRRGSRRGGRRGYFSRLRNLVRSRDSGEHYGDSAEYVVRGRLGVDDYEDDHSGWRPRRIRLGRRRGGRRGGKRRGPKRQRMYTEVFDEAYDRQVHSNLRVCRTLYRECPTSKKSRKRKLFRLRI